MPGDEIIELRKTSPPERNWKKIGLYAFSGACVLAATVYAVRNRESLVETGRTAIKSVEASAKAAFKKLALSVADTAKPDILTYPGVSQITDYFAGWWVDNMIANLPGVANSVSKVLSDGSVRDALDAAAVQNLEPMAQTVFRVIRPFAPQLKIGETIIINPVASPLTRNVVDRIAHNMIVDVLKDYPDAVNALIKLGRAAFKTKDGFMLAMYIFGEPAVEITRGVIRIKTEKVFERISDALSKIEVLPVDDMYIDIEELSRATILHRRESTATTPLATAESPVENCKKYLEALKQKLVEIVPTPAQQPIITQLNSIITTALAPPKTEDPLQHMRRSLASLELLVGQLLTSTAPAAPVPGVPSHVTSSSENIPAAKQEEIKKVLAEIKAALGPTGTPQPRTNR